MNADVTWIEDYAQRKDFQIAIPDSIEIHSDALGHNELIVKLGEKYSDACLCFFSGNATHPAFCGIFIQSVNKQSNVRLLKREIGDVFSSRMHRTGKPYVDRRITIVGSDFPKLKVNHTIAWDFLNLQKQFGDLYLETEEKPTFCKSVFDTSTISLRSKKWIQDEKDLDLFLSQGINILKGVNRYLHL